MTRRSRSRTARLRPISEEPILFGRVIAEREYRLGRQRVVAQLGTPHRASWKTDWYCAYRIVIGREKKLGRAFGVDALQALELALEMLRVRLEVLSPRINWDAGEQAGDVGISKRIATGLGFAFEKRLAQMVSKASLAEERRRERSRDKGRS